MRYLIPIAILFVFTFCENPADSTENNVKEDNNTISVDSSSEIIEDVIEPVKINIDSFQTGFANLISGLDDSYFDESVIDTSYWNAYAENTNKSFSKIKKDRLDIMTSWFKKETQNKIEDTSLLFYPFSGADFLHAYHLYPNANEIIMLAKESIGEIPNFNTMKKKEINEYLEGVDFSLRDIYRRSYFITKNMSSDIKKSPIKGLLPLFYWFIARTDHQIVEKYDVYINENGNKRVKDSSFIKNKNIISGVEFKIMLNGTNNVKTLTYFDCDISNDGFEKNPEFKIYLDNKRPSNTFIKSASYLLHYSTFSEIRDIIISSSNFIIEDDTGIPFKYFDLNNWDVSLYGVYVKPIKDFSKNRFQTDLEKAYNNDKYFAGDLPFSLGYHWGTELQNQMTYKKKME